ncbi:MAG: 23S rRNA (adenine(2503)-C(2))-methyltransferase RlmN [Candidatus Ancaeobacter aquaticus]|nr:23S rRNA (adenine(2503)-C(2))-methyltransferase RlmN [Candidatus Ancaeobacter aquaticus]
MNDLTNFTLQELELELQSQNYKSYRIKQILSWLYKKGASSFENMSDIPNNMRDFLNNHFNVLSLTTFKKYQSENDLTAKYLFKTHDDNIIESVYLAEKKREIVCISSQIGCPLGCSFCASGKSLFKRNLTTGEIVSQVILIKNDYKKERINNIVYMGMGEPFLNYENVMKSINILRAHWGIEIGSRKITISTAGHVPGILRFAKEKTQIRLSVSLHATNDILRDILMPINKQYPLDTLMHALREYVSISNRRISIEYTLIEGMNDSLADAHALYTMVKDITHTINIIPLNVTNEFKHNAPSLERQKAFQNTLIKLGILTTLRKEKGGDIGAACGQLRMRTLKDNKS